MTERLPDLTADALRLAHFALAEDGGSDVTTAVTVAPGLQGTGRIEFRSPGVLGGVPYADAAIAAAGAPAISWTVANGDAIESARVVGTLAGGLATILRVERTLLNLLQRASGIATATRAYVDAVAGTPCRILPTRKTAPGLRIFDAAAVVAGGGGVHRLDLAHAVMVKDNHWKALERGGQTLREALARARGRGVSALYVEVETTEQVETACAAGATRLLVDNQAPDTVRSWAGLARNLARGIEIEATGGITLANVRDYATAGVDYVSIGALTHSVMAADIALEVLADD